MIVRSKVWDNKNNNWLKAKLQTADAKLAEWFLEMAEKNCKALNMLHKWLKQYFKTAEQDLQRVENFRWTCETYPWKIHIHTNQGKLSRKLYWLPDYVYNKIGQRLKKNKGKRMALRKQLWEQKLPTSLCFKCAKIY